jgi:hypothetical protein
VELSAFRVVITWSRIGRPSARVGAVLRISHSRANRAEVSVCTTRHSPVIADSVSTTCSAVNRRGSGPRNWLVRLASAGCCQARLVRISFTSQ